jgi:hypothetical protein
MSNPGPAVTNTPHILFNADSTDGTAFAPFGGPVGFFGATPASQPTAATNVHTVAAGSTTAAYVNTTYDGSIGSTAYTIGDVVAALKTLGLIKS